MSEAGRGKPDPVGGGDEGKSTPPLCFEGGDGVSKTQPRSATLSCLEVLEEV